MEERLLQFLKAENLTQSEFSDRIGVTRASVSHIISGRNKPGFDFIEALTINFPALNLEWLITGKGKMYNTAGSVAVDKPSTLSEDDNLFPSEAPAGPRIDEPQPQNPRISYSQKPEPRPSATKSGQGHGKISKIFVLFEDGTYQLMGE